MAAVRLDRRAVAARGELEAADRAAGEQADDHRDHRGDEAAERPAEDGDDAMLFGAAPAAPHQERDHDARRGAAEHAGGGGEQAVDVALAFGEGARAGEGVSSLDSPESRMFDQMFDT